MSDTGQHLSVNDERWQKWGETNPYQGVLGVESGSMSDEALREKFFSSGDDDVGLVLDNIERRAPGFVARGGDVLDFGCGVGRLMAAFAKRGFRVTGVDVSPAMIAEATRNLAGYGEKLAGFTSLQDAGTERYDLVHSHIVIQHIRPVQGLPIIRQLIGAVRKGGFLAIQFTMGSPDWRRTAANWLRYRLPPLQFAFNIVRGRPASEPVMELNTYDLHAILGLCAENGIDDVAVFRHGGHTYRGIMIVGRKLGAS